ncbi:hypothetical protein ACFL1K_03590 [Candidatus Omnitrophota bacterium]
MKDDHGKKRLPQGVRKYIRRQRLIIKGMAKDKAEEVILVKELLDRIYKIERFKHLLG